MNILAIDPGNEQSAIVMWDGKSIGAKDLLPNGTILTSMKVLAREYGVENICCERIASYGMPVGKEIFNTCFWTGRFWQVAVNAGVSFFLVPRLKVKMALCGSARAKDSNIRQALVDRFGPPGTKKAQGLTYGLKADLWAAFALAVTCHDHPEVKEEGRQ